MRDEIAMVEQCAGCEHLDNEKQVGGTGHCYMFREPILNCSQYKEPPSDPGGYDDDLVKRLQQRLVELTIELSRHKEAIHNYMSMGHAGEQDEVVQIFMDEYLPDEPEDDALSS